jgi:hypothetical protein
VKEAMIAETNEKQEWRPMFHLPSLNAVRPRLRQLRWIVPFAMMLLVVFYELVPARALHGRFGYSSHILAEILLFGTLGPLLTFVMLHLLERWLEERDTSDLQAQLLQEARADVDRTRQLSDDALQVLFAAGTLIDTLKATHPDLDEATTQQIDTAEEALEDAISHLRCQLLEER